MKPSLMALIGALIILTCFETAPADTEKGDVEISGSAAFMSKKSEYSSESLWSLHIATRLGVFITGNFEIEPEILLSKFKEEDVGYVLSGNLAYNLKVGEQESRIMPFVLAGIGYSNTIMYLPEITYIGSDSANWIVLNLGGGFKIFAAESVAFRLEYRFQQFYEDVDYTNHSIFIGISGFPK